MFPNIFWENNKLVMPLLNPAKILRKFAFRSLIKKILLWEKVYIGVGLLGRIGIHFKYHPRDSR